MSRERFIDPAIWKSEQLISLEPRARLLFIGIITTADDSGRRKATPASLRADIFPLEDVPLSHVQAWRNSLAAAGLVRLYQDEYGTPLVDLPMWAKYQRPRHVRKSRFPEFPGAGELACDGGVTAPPEPAPPCAVTDASVPESVPVCTEPAQGWGGEGWGGSEGSNDEPSQPAKRPVRIQAWEKPEVREAYNTFCDRYEGWHKAYGIPALTGRESMLRSFWNCRRLSEDRPFKRLDEVERGIRNMRARGLGVPGFAAMLRKPKDGVFGIARVLSYATAAPPTKDDGFIPFAKENP